MRNSKHKNLFFQFLIWYFRDSTINLFQVFFQVIKSHSTASLTFWTHTTWTYQSKEFLNLYEKMNISTHSENVCYWQLNISLEHSLKRKDTIYREKKSSPLRSRCVYVSLKLEPILMAVSFHIMMSIFWSRCNYAFTGMWWPKNFGY